MKKIYLLLLLALSFIIFSCVYIYISNPSLILKENYHIQYKFRNDGKELHTGDKIVGEFIARENSLGSIAIPFETFKRINEDTVIFSIKEKGAKQWYYKNEYNTDQFTGNHLFPFGFPIILDSKNKTFLFQIESKNGRKNNAVIVQYGESIVATYQFSKERIFASKNIPSSIIDDKFLHFTQNRFMVVAIVAISLVTSLFLVWGDKSVQQSKRLLRLILNLLVIVVNKILQGSGLRRILVVSIKKLKVKISPQKKFEYFSLSIIIFLGLVIRLYLALGSYNSDIFYFMQDADLFREGKNIYIYQTAYNYSPIFFYVLGILGFIHKLIGFLPFEFIIRAFISLVDVSTVLVLYKIARYIKVSPIKTTALFFLNPVSIIISGHHGQFDNLALLFILLAILLHYRPYKKNRFKFIWLLATIGITIKHNIIYLPLIIFSHLTKNKSKAFILFSISILVFLLSFAPYVYGAMDKIIKQAFVYGGAETFSGFTYIISNLCTECTMFGITLVKVYKYLFIIALFAFSLLVRGKDLARSCLLGVLFFFTFTSGIAAQYFVIPIALGSLFPTKWFKLYSLVATFSLLGVAEEWHIPVFRDFSWNIVWFFVVLWFVSELINISKTTQKIYKRIL